MKELTTALKNLGFSEKYIKVLNSTNNIDIGEKEFDTMDYKTFEDQLITSSTAYYEPISDLVHRFFY